MKKINILSISLLFFNTLLSLSIPSANITLDHILPNPRIIATGVSFNGVSLDMAVVRYNTTGSLDQSFGSINGDGNLFPGMATIDFNLQQDSVGNSVLVDNLQRIVVAGYATTTTVDPSTGLLLQTQNFALARFTPIGQLDTTFNPNSTFDATSKPGSLQTKIGVTAEANALILDSSNRLVAGGFSNSGTEESNLANSFTLARYNPNGSLDNTFGTRGIVITTFDDDTVINGLTEDPSENLVAVGTIGDNDFLIARYKTNGDLDDTFNPTSDVPGVVELEIDDPNTGEALTSIAYSVIIDNAGNIVVAGVGYLDSAATIIVARFLPDGTLDPSFGDFGTNGGLQLIPITSANIIVDSLAIDSTNKIVVSASSYNVNGSGISYSDPFGLFRLNPDGTIDTTFQQHNSVVTPNQNIRTENTFLIKNGVVIDNKNRIVVGGFVNQSRNINSMIIARYNPDGTFDATFNPTGATPGVVITDLFFGASQPSRFLQVGVLNRIAICGQSFNGLTFSMALLRYNNDGTPDATFGVPLAALNEDVAEATSLVSNQPVPGMVTVNILGGDNAANSLVIDQNFNYVIGGYAGMSMANETFGYVTDPTPTSTVGIGDGSADVLTTSTEITQFAIVRFLENGTLDPDFFPANDDETESNIPGTIVTQIGNTSQAEAIIVDAQNKYVLGGFSSEGPNEFDNITLARYLPTDGSLDKSFGPFGDGTTITELAGDSIAYGLTQDQADRYVACGSFNFSQVLVVRYNGNGIPDVSFNGAGPFPGAVITPIGGFAAEVYTVTIDRSHNIVVAGVAQNTTVSNLIVLRYTQLGTLDPTFGVGGIATINVPYFNIIVSSCVIDQNNRIMLTALSRNTDVTLKTAFNYTDPFVALRLLPNGTIDPTFIPHGLTAQPTAVPTGPQEPGIGKDNFTDVSNAVLIDPFNRVLVGGYFNLRTKVNNIVMARYLPSGLLDISFNPTGTDLGSLVNPDNFTDIPTPLFLSDPSTLIPPGIVLTNTFFDTTTPNPGGTPTPLPSVQVAESPEELKKLAARGIKRAQITTIPIIDYPLQDFRINTKTPIFKGRARPAGFISIIIDNQLATIVPTDTLGGWEYTAQLAEGKHTLVVNNLDTMGKIMNSSAPVTFTIIATALRPPTILAPASNSTMRERTVMFAGSSQPDSLVALFVDNTLVNTIRSGDQGQWSYSLDLSDGSHTVYAGVTDGISKMSPFSPTVTFTVSPATRLLPPVIIAPIHNKQIKSNRITIRGTAVAKNTILLKLDTNEIARIPVNGKGEWKYLMYLSNGQYTVQASQVDAAHIESKPSVPITFTVDTRKSRPFFGKSLPSIITEDTTLTGKVPSGADVSIIIDQEQKGHVQADQSGTWSYLLKIDELEPGTHTIGTLIQDKKNNRSWLSSHKIVVESNQASANQKGAVQKAEEQKVEDR